MRPPSPTHTHQSLASAGAKRSGVVFFPMVERTVLKGRRMDDDLGDLETASTTKWVGVAIVVLLATAWGSLALAAPRAESAQECTIAADMAVVARALAEERVEQPMAEQIMRRIYNVSPSPRGQELMRTILDTAYREKQSASAFANKLYLACMVTGGNMDEVLGLKL